MNVISPACSISIRSLLHCIYLAGLRVDECASECSDDNRATMDLMTQELDAGEEVGSTNFMIHSLHNEVHIRLDICYNSFKTNMKIDIWM